MSIEKSGKSTLSTKITLMTQDNVKELKILKKVTGHAEVKLSLINKLILVQWNFLTNKSTD